MICQETPNLSFNHPHCSCSPPSASLSQYVSTSSCELQLTNIETPQVNGTSIGWPLSIAIKSSPSSLKEENLICPSGPGSPFSYREIKSMLEFGNCDVQKSSASS